MYLFALLSLVLVRVKVNVRSRFKLGIISESAIKPI